MVGYSSFVVGHLGLVIRHSGFHFFSLAEPGKGGEGGFAFGGFFALALATGQFDSAMMDGTLEDAVVVGAGGRDDGIMRGLGGDSLEEFLEFAFGVFEDGNNGEAAEGVLELVQNKIAGGFKAAIEKDGAQERLEGVGQGGGALAAAVLLLAAAEQQVFAEAETPAMLGQGAAIDHFGASLGERAFAHGGEFFVELASEDELQDGVTEELEALIGLDGRALLVGDRGMGQGKA
jgi:hypothetical protein